MLTAPLSVLIVDDEPLARDGLRLLLAEDPAPWAVREARTAAEAIAAITAQRPDLVLLDIQLPGASGFDVIQAIGAEQMPEVVFVTAHDQYAIAAFEISAVDYLQKPVARERFARALARARARLAARVEAAGPPQTTDLMAALAALMPKLGAAPTPHRGPARLAVRDGERTVFLAVEDLEWMSGAENYVELHPRAAAHGAAGSYLLQVTMNALERALDPDRFLRIHRSLIVQVGCIVEARPTASGEYQLTLESGTRVRSGRTYQARIKQLLRNPF